MTLKNYKRLMKLHKKSFDKLWSKMVEETNQLLDDNPDLTLNYLNHKPIEDMIDRLALSSGWLADRLERRICISHHKTYRGSLTKKIRKALGYNL